MSDPQQGVAGFNPRFPVQPLTTGGGRRLNGQIDVRPRSRVPTGPRAEQYDADDLRLRGEVLDNRV